MGQSRGCHQHCHGWALQLDNHCESQGAWSERIAADRHSMRDDDREAVHHSSSHPKQAMLDGGLVSWVRHGGRVPRRTSRLQGQHISPSTPIRVWARQGNRTANQCRGSICEVHHNEWRLAICCRSCRGHATARPNAESGAAQFSKRMFPTSKTREQRQSHQKVLSQDIKARCSIVLKHPLKVTCWWCDNFETTVTSGPGSQGTRQGPKDHDT